MTSETPTRPGLQMEALAEALDVLDKAGKWDTSVPLGEVVQRERDAREAVVCAARRVVDSGRGGEVPNQPTPPENPYRRRAHEGFPRGQLARAWDEGYAAASGAVAVPEDRPEPEPLDLDQHDPTGAGWVISDEYFAAAHHDRPKPGESYWAMEQPDPEQPPRLVWFHPELIDAAVIDVDDVMMSIEERTEGADLAALSEQAITDLCHAISRASHDRAEADACRAALGDPTTPSPAGPRRAIDDVLDLLDAMEEESGLTDEERAIREGLKSLADSLDAPRAAPSGVSEPSAEEGGS